MCIIIITHHEIEHIQLHTSVNGDYMIEVLPVSYYNPTNGAADNGGGCCDNSSSTECSGSDRCDNLFIFCLRPFNTPHSERDCVEGLPTLTRGPFDDGGMIPFNHTRLLYLNVSGPQTVSMTT